MTAALMTRKQVAEFLHVSVRTVENYCQRGLLPFSRIPAGKRFDPTDLQVFVANRKFHHHP